MRTAIIGGDRRMLYAAAAFAEDGFEISITGFDRADIPGGLINSDFSGAIGDSDIVVLPVRPIEGGYLSTPYSDDRIGVKELFTQIGSRPVFGGCGDILRGYAFGSVYDYTAREEFSVYNAALTAEGALGLIVDEYEGSIFGSSILVTGYGRIGRLMSGYLDKLCADVTVAVRSEAARARAITDGIRVCNYSDLELYIYDIIINTVPAQVITAAHIDRMRTDALIIDLASAPGGVDMSRAEERGIRCIHALGLPGKTAPAAAGRIIKNTICNIIKEENGGKDHSGLCDDRLLLHL